MINLGFNEFGYMYPSNVKGKTNKTIKDNFIGTFLLTYDKDKKGVWRIYLDELDSGLKYIIKEESLMFLFKNGMLNSYSPMKLRLSISGNTNSRWCVIDESFKG